MPWPFGLNHFTTVLHTIFINVKAKRRLTAGKQVCKPLLKYYKLQLCNMNNPVVFILLLAVAIQLVMHHCNMVISGSLEARNNNIDGFMRHGRPNDKHLPSNYIALQGQQLCEGSFEKHISKATVQSHKNSAGECTNINVICHDLYHTIVIVLIPPINKYK